MPFVVAVSGDHILAKVATKSTVKLSLGWPHAHSNSHYRVV